MKQKEISIFLVSPYRLEESAQLSLENENILQIGNSVFSEKSIEDVKKRSSLISSLFIRFYY